MFAVAAFALAFALALSEADSPMLLWLIIGGLMALGPVVHSYIKVYEWFRGKSVDTSNFVTKAELKEKSVDTSGFVTRAELATVKAERDVQMAATIGEIKADLKDLEKTLSDIARDLPAIHRALGRLEGHDDRDGPRRAH